MFSIGRNPGFLILAASVAGVMGIRADAEVTHVTVGVTPTCPYGLKSCWSGARAGLHGLSGVRSAPDAPDIYNCTAEIHFVAPGLPDVELWEREFGKTVGDLYGFRGVEVTINGFVEIIDNDLVLRSPGMGDAILLARFEHKLQYNFRKHKTRQAEPDENAAYEQLFAQIKVRGNQKTPVEIVGPLRQSGGKPVIEIREGHVLLPE